MYFIFVVNGRADKAPVLDELQRQISAMQTFEHEIYVIRGVGDGTRFVRTYSDLHPNHEVCFVACGGSGTINEVAAGIVGYPKMCMGILALTGTADFVKIFPDRTFHSVKALVESQEMRWIDIIKANDDYALNACDFGFDGKVCETANYLTEEGKTDGYSRGVVSALFTGRFNRISVEADGERIGRGLMLLCVLGNGRYTGGAYMSTPYAKVDDGLMDLCYVKPISLLTFISILPIYKKGKHFETHNVKDNFVYRRVKHVEIKSDKLIPISLDGEILMAKEVQVDLLEKAVRLLLPPSDGSQRPGDSPFIEV